MDNPLATWWAHSDTSDWTFQSPQPQAYRAACDHPIDGTNGIDNWPKTLRHYGYESVGPPPDDLFSAFEVAVWKHTDGHLLVELWDGSIAFAQFFVAEPNAVAFWLKRYPTLHATMRRDTFANCWEKLPDALYAFIRHGHGIDTVSEDGTTLEEMRQQNEQWREFQRRKAEQKTG